MFSIANAADAVRIVGTRIGGSVPLFKARAGEPDVGSARTFTVALSAVDDTLTAAGGTWLATKAFGETLDAPTFAHTVGAAIKSAYAAASGNQLMNSLERRYADPEPNNLSERKPYLNSKRIAGGAALLLAGNTLGQAAWAYFHPDDDKKPTPGGSPAPTPTTSTQPPVQPPVQPPIQPPVQPPSPAQVVVSAHDPRRATLWGIADANASTLLSKDEIASARQSGGDNAVVLDALQQLFQVNPQRGFRPELMDGIATALRGDPDTIQPGWTITVEKPAG